MVLTRRALLERIGAAGGSAAAYLAMEAMGLAIPTPAGAENFKLPPESGIGQSVVVLGAGIAGLVSALRTFSDSVTWQASLAQGRQR